jgi:hypothetical protein
VVLYSVSVESTFGASAVKVHLVGGFEETFRKQRELEATISKDRVIMMDGLGVFERRFGYLRS